jgi:hypothetical protein
MAVYKTIPLTQATDRQVQQLAQEDFDAAKAIVFQFITFFKQKHS